MRVLVLDDDVELSQTLAQMLTARQLEVDCSHSAPHALNLVKEKAYDLVLLDYAMPEYDGVWFLTNANLPRSTKVILITGHIERQMINAMFKLGACGYMIKPFDEADLVRHLNFFLPGQLSG